MVRENTLSSNNLPSYLKIKPMSVKTQNADGFEQMLIITITRIYVILKYISK